MSRKYRSVKVERWINGTPYDSWGNVLDINHLYEENGIFYSSKLTDPLNIKAYGVGSKETYVVFDYAKFNDKIILHSVTYYNSERLMKGYNYRIVPFEIAASEANDMFEQALKELSEAGVKNDGWGETGYEFCIDVKNFAEAQITTMRSEKKR